MARVKAPPRPTPTEGVHLAQPPDPPGRSGTSTCPSGPLGGHSQSSAQEGSGTATCPTTAGAGADASLPLEDSPTRRWGVDILGPFPRAVGECQFLYVAIDKFTKWPKVTPMVNITKGSAVAFSSSPLCAGVGAP